MEISKEEFEEKFRQGNEILLERMANHSQINVETFFSMACFFENLTFFAPVLFDLLQKPENKE